MGCYDSTLHKITPFVNLRAIVCANERGARGIHQVPQSRGRPGLTGRPSDPDGSLCPSH